MTPDDIQECTALNNIKAVWDIWGGSLPIVWHTRMGFMTAILTPPDGAGHVMIAVPPKRYMLASLEDLVEIRKGTIVYLDDGRAGKIKTYKAFSSFFFFEDEEREGSSLVGMSQIVKAIYAEEAA